MGFNIHFHVWHLPFTLTTWSWQVLNMCVSWTSMVLSMCTMIFYLKFGRSIDIWPLICFFETWEFRYHMGLFHKFFTNLLFHLFEVWTLILLVVQFFSRIGHWTKSLNSLFCYQIEIWKVMIWKMSIYIYSKTLKP
jgi:hypothetical protein